MNYIKAARAEGAKTWEQIAIVLEGWLEEADKGYSPGYMRAKARMNGTPVPDVDREPPITLREGLSNVAYDGSSKFTNY